MTRRRGPFVFLCLLIGLFASPAWAIKAWYDYYAEGQELARLGRHKEALKALQEAVNQKPESDLNARTYGMEFVKYVPHYHMGLSYLKLGDHDSAEREFKLETSRNKIQKNSELFADLQRQMLEIDNRRRADAVQGARDQIARLEKEANELHAKGRFDDALARLAQAIGGARELDPTTERRLTAQRDKILEQQRFQAAAADKTRRVEQDLAEGRRLLEDGRPADAIVRFDQVLGVEPGNRLAGDGKRDAQERIRASKDQEALDKAYLDGKALFDAGRHDDALVPLTTAAADPKNAAARELRDRVQKIAEGLRREKETRQKIDALTAEAEALIKAGKFPEAQVRLESVLRSDPGNTRARERLGFAETRSVQELVTRFLPNRPPELVMFEPREQVVTIEGPSVSIQGVASDDHRVAMVEFLAGGKQLAALLAQPDASGFSANLAFDRVFPLQPGLNEINVVATDNLGMRHEETYKITRKLRLYETRAFAPAAGAAALGLLGLGVGMQHWRRRRAVRSRFNPYIAGAPVMDAELFFGRAKLMARIMNVLHHNSLMITGERRIGKTTFLYHLKKALESDDNTEYRFFPVLTDLQGVGEDDFFHAVMTDVVEALSPDAAALRYLPEDERYDGRDFSHDLQRVVEQLKARTPKRVKLALLIDEVDVLNEFSERINQRLRSIFMKTFSENLVAIMSGVGIRRSWQSEGSPWYNFFDEIELSSLTREDARALITTPVEGVFRYEPQAVERILEWSELKPYLIQRFCIYAVNRMLEERRTLVSERDVQAVRESVQLEGREPEPIAPALRRQASA